MTGGKAPRTGADRIWDTLLSLGVDVCFANPGTSEMHLVAALDRRASMRAVLGLAEGVVTGAADGYARMTGRPAVTLLHLGPGLSNGSANLHNARRAGSQVINLVGDYTDAHLDLDAPLASDIEGLSRPISGWQHRMGSASDIERDVTAAWRASSEGEIATLVVPADIAWSGDVSQSTPAEPVVPRSPAPIGAALADAVAALRHGSRCVLVLGGDALAEAPLQMAARIAAATGARFFAEGANRRIARGRGRPGIRRLPFQYEAGAALLADAVAIILVGAREPVTFFPYPDLPGRLRSEHIPLFAMAGPGAGAGAALHALADAVGVPADATADETVFLSGPRPVVSTYPLAEGPLTAAAVNRIVADTLPGQAVVCDEVITSTGFYELSYGAPAHDYLQLTGGAIGIGLPLAAGAAIGAPGRKVVALQADGSAMYTLQALWTIAREELDVAVVIFANRSYAILQNEMRKVGVQEIGARARQMLSLDAPVIDWVSLARGMGVGAAQAATVENFRTAWEGALGKRGPFLVEAVIV